VSFRAALIVLNALAFLVIAAVVVGRVLSLRRNPEPPPRNLTPFLPDEDLEGRRLERVLGWALLFTLIIAIAVPVYFLVEPSREASAKKNNFEEPSIERGRVLFANNQSPVYDSTASRLCANCHGADAKGGSAQQTLQPESDECVKKQNQGRADIPECLPKQVSWQAPDLTLAALRYPRSELVHIIT
jgi:cytochrome c553